MIKSVYLKIKSNRIDYINKSTIKTKFLIIEVEDEYLGELDVRWLAKIIDKEGKRKR